MRLRRLKLPPDQPAVYHCISRIVGGRFWLDRRSREAMHDHLRRAAAFCGVEVLTFALMSNHFHLLVRIPARRPLSDEELVGRVAIRYGEEEEGSGRSGALRSLLKRGGAEANLARSSLEARMGDLSMFLKEFKQLFTIWYNRKHKHFGTIWAERFKSVLCEDSPEVLMRVAAYIDLNPLRAGLVGDPQHYRWCGYGRAVAGCRRAQAGLRHLLREPLSWNEFQRRYRRLIFGLGTTHTKHTPQAVVSARHAQEVARLEGEIPWPQLLRTKLKFWVEGVILGSEEFVARWSGAAGLGPAKPSSGKGKEKRKRPLAHSPPAEPAG